ncbi:MAG: type II secretion system protein [Planctomycetaceae bacterium]|nr:type II secretion system protein [Planctomycetaceae bacterium]
MNTAVSATYRDSRSAFTLIEMVLVLIVLTALAALLVPLIGGIEVNEKSSQQIVTEASMNSIRDAILGSEDTAGAWADLGQISGFFPLSLDYLLLSDGEITSVPQYGSIGTFDPTTRIGWRGPYLSNSTSLLDGWGNNILMQVDFNGNGSVDKVGTLQEARYARLVSAGPNQVYDATISDGFIPGDGTGLNQISMAECDDDIVIFLRVADMRQ